MEEMQFAFSTDKIASVFFWDKRKTQIQKMFAKHQQDFVQFYKMIDFGSTSVSFLYNKPESKNPEYKVQIMKKHM